MTTSESVTKYYSCDDNGHCSPRSTTSSPRTTPKFFEPGAVAYVQFLAQNMLTPDTKTDYYHNTSGMLYGGGYCRSYSGSTCTSGCGPSTVSIPYRSKGTLSPF